MKIEFPDIKGLLPADAKRIVNCVRALRRATDLLIEIDEAHLPDGLIDIKRLVPEINLKLEHNDRWCVRAAKNAFKALKVPEDREDQLQEVSDRLDKCLTVTGVRYVLDSIVMEDRYCNEIEMKAEWLINKYGKYLKISKRENNLKY
jgi:hypothetical protein